MNALAVMPWTWSSSWVVMTVTPVANIPSVRGTRAAGSCPGSPAISSSSASGVSSGNVSPIPAWREPAVHREVELERRRAGGGAIDHASSRGTGE